MDQPSSHTETSVSSIAECGDTTNADPTTALLACRLLLERSQSLDADTPTLLIPITHDLENGSVQRQDQAYFNMLLRFFWSSLVPERFRSYFADHPTTAAIVMLLTFACIGLILYYTGNFVMLGVYVKLVFCFLFGGEEGADGPFKFCWA